MPKRQDTQNVHKSYIMAAHCHIARRGLGKVNSRFLKQENVALRELGKVTLGT